MKAVLKTIKIKDLVQDYQNNDEKGVVGYRGKLDIRPPYQREFVYDPPEQEAVIDTISKNLPLNVMYWVERGNGNFEVMDGQQRTLSICEFVEGNNLYVKINGSNNPRAFENLEKDEKKQILDYELMIYFCEGTDKEKLDWFEIVNIAGKELSKQELRNAVYHGPWVTEAKKYFSKRDCRAYQIGNKYLNCKLNRQEYLEKAIKWINKGEIELYMANNQNKQNAKELEVYFESVIKWVEATFPEYRSKLMKGLEWGYFYNEFRDEKLDPTELEKQIKILVDDEEIQKQKGIYEYLLTGNEKHLNLRSFSDKQKQIMFERQKGVCPHCTGKDKNKKWDIGQMHADHKIAWSKGGKTEIENGQMLCRECNLEKSNK